MSIPDTSLIKFPTNKPHVSYSEVRCWKECPWRHKLLYIDKIGVNEPSPYLSYGTAVHDGLERFLKTGEMDIPTVLEKITGEWAFLKEEFGDYEVISAEEELYEYYPGCEIFFKGFIDALLKVTIRGKEHYYVIDWKTAGDKGWYASKRRDILTWAQIALYKTFWRNKRNLDTKSVRCGFVLLKRGAPAGKICELVKVSVGPKAEENAMSIFRSMVKNVRRGLFLKNRESCLFCEFKDTPHCPGRT